MRIETNPNKLGDKLLSGKEELQRQYEKTEKRIAEYRLPDHEHLKDTAARTGTTMHHTEFVRKVIALNPKLWYEPSYANILTVGGLYYDKPGEGKSAACIFDQGSMPEFTYITVDAADLPVAKKPGWRNALVQLFQKGLLTRQQIIANFGDPSPNERTARWDIQFHKGV